MKVPPAVVRCPLCGEGIEYTFTLDIAPIHAVGELRLDMTVDRAPFTAHFDTHGPDGDGGEPVPVPVAS